MAGLEVRRVGPHEFVGRNDRGAEICLGRSGVAGRFSPAELLEIALAACAAVTAEELIIRRKEQNFTVRADGDRPAGAHQFDTLRLSLDFDMIGAGRITRPHVEAAIRRALDLQCAVSRTIKKGTPVEIQFE
jgi:uncharacterized OsmC-like protein